MILAVALTRYFMISLLKACTGSGHVIESTPALGLELPTELLCHYAGPAMSADCLLQIAPAVQHIPNKQQFYS